jgi:hypothetical protein
MNRRVCVTACVAAALLWFGGTPVRTWGFDIHRFITDQAIALLPDEIRPFYEKHRTFVVEHAVDPDLWRLAGFEEEPPRHFLDLDAYGSPPFTALPRDRELAIAKFGRPMVEKNGTLPWRVGEVHGQLVGAFRQQTQGTSRWALDNIKFFSAVLSHYVADAHVPFHAVVNYDGQLTNQHGIHSRFETDLFHRYRSRLQVKPVPIPAVDRPVDFIFDVLIDGAGQVEGLLQADRVAIGDGQVYDDQYFDRMRERSQAVLETQLSRAIAGVAAVITGAWQAGGRPDLPLDPPKSSQRRRAVTGQ